MVECDEYLPGVFPLIFPSVLVLQRMKMCSARMILSAIILFLISLLDVSCAVSLYGNDFLHVPFRDAGSTTNVRLEFRTSVANGVLFVAAGSTDYCIIELKSGTIQVRIELGSGETVLESPPGLYLNDLAWHVVNLKRKGGNVQLTVDYIYETTKRIPGRFYELNIDDGVYVGGVRDTGGLYYTHNLLGYRGCLKHIHFNTYSILDIVRHSKGNKKITKDVQSHCSREFNSEPKQAISFTDKTSYVGFFVQSSQNEMTFACNLRTRSKTGIVLFILGRKLKSNFILLVLNNGLLTLSTKRNGKVKSVSTKIILSDGNKHYISLKISALHMELETETEHKQHYFTSEEQSSLDLSSMWFIGGLSSKMTTIAANLGIDSLKNLPKNIAGISLQGCMKDVKIDGKAMGLLSAQITHLITPGCAWTFPCSASPCDEGSVCVEHSYTQFECIIKDLKTTTDYMLPADATVLPTVDLVRLHPLVVREGGSEVITENNVDFVFNYRAYGMRDSAIFFHVVEPPKYGELDVRVRSRSENSLFTLLDLTIGKVLYINDGSEENSDQVTFAVELLGGADSDLPEILKKPYRFTLTIQVQPVNDPPILKLPPGGTVGVLKHAKTPLSQESLNVVDPDSNPDQITYNVAFEGTEHVVASHFELVQKPGESVTAFTQKEVADRKVFFVNQGEQKTRVNVQVNDGKDSSVRKMITFVTIPIELSVTHNTGVKVFPTSYSLILPENLTTATNIQRQDIDVRYEITKSPKYGEIQKQKSSTKEWFPASIFSQKHIDRGRLRYFHTGRALHVIPDMFVFTASTQGASIQSRQFHITFDQVQLQLNKNTKLQLEGVMEMELNKSHLSASTNNPNTLPDAVMYKLITTPRQGHLLKLKNSNSNEYQQRLGQSSNFTQKDINDGLILYKLHRTLDNVVNDNFQFRLQFKDAGSIQSTAFTFEIEFIPVESDILFTNRLLKDVLEGGRKVITRDYFYLETDQISEFKFTLLTFPNHGILQLINSESDTIISNNISQFSNADIREGNVVYKHDDSEYEFDSFDFMATPIIGPSPEDKLEMEIVEYTDTFHIKILLRNDNPPVRVVDKVFNIVRNGMRPFTDEDIKYTDPDINFDSSNLQYTRRGISNGEIVNSTHPTLKVYHFTQKDLETGQLMFVHKGKEYARISIKVTDGQFHDIGLMTIHASDPYIKLINNTGLAVFKGKSVALRSDNLSIETNINAADNEIRIIIISAPRYGKILRREHISSEFNMQDVKRGHVKYEHGNSGHVKDSFKFAIHVKDVSIQGTCNITVFLEDHHHPPKFQHNKMLVVEEGHTGVISDNILLVTHSITPPEGISFTIQDGPKFGHLDLDSQLNVHNFTQGDIDSGKLTYVHTEPGVVEDVITFDVSNGVLTLQGLEFVIDIIPEVLPVSVTNITLKEGGTKALTKQYIQVTNKHFKDDNFEYEITQQPNYGWIERTQAQGVRLDQFSSQDIHNEFIYYTHNGEEFYTDEFTVLARAMGSGKQSKPHTIYITLIPVNDQVPQIVTNKDLHVWKGSITLLTSAHLSATDQDTLPGDLRYKITSPDCGYVALKEKTGDEIVQFTQAMLDSNQLVFVHSGDASGSFHFQVNDGINYSDREIFRITASPLVLHHNTDAKLDVYPGTLHPVTVAVLNASTNDANQTRPLVYTLKTRPRYGKLVTTVNGSNLEVSSFTQAEVNAGEIAYQHMQALSQWSIDDTFTYELSTLYAASVTERLEISISYDNINAKNQDQLVKMSEVKVLEGGQITFNENHLDVSRLTEKIKSISRSAVLKFFITKFPSHGYLLINDLNATAGAYFLEKEIKNNRFKYLNDHSDAYWDSFEFSLKVTGLGSKMTSPKFNATVNITIIPVNDQPFRIVTKHPTIEVIQGFTINITPQHLKTTDLDSPPENLTYTILTGPTNGIVAFANAPKLAISSFTQKDINQLRLIFVQDGTRASGTFNFKVSDGQFDPFYKVFTINVIPLTLDVVSSSGLQLLQSQSAVHLNQSHLNISTNGLQEDITFFISEPPQFGKLFIEDKTVEQFSHHSLIESQVVYIQTDMTAGHDSFVLNATIADHYITVPMSVSVQPFVKQGNVSIPSGSRVPISLSELNATALAIATNSNPVYYVIKRPVFGILKKTIIKRSTQSVDGSFTFTHDDIIKNSVYYEADLVHVPTNGLIHDKFGYRLTAPNVQPAEGEVIIKLQPPLLTTGAITQIPGLEKEKGADQSTMFDQIDNGDAERKNNSNSDSVSIDKAVRESDISGLPPTAWVITLVLAVVVTLVLLMIGIAVCKYKYDQRKRGTFQPQREDSQTPLSQSHVTIEPQRWSQSQSMDELPQSHLMASCSHRSPPRSPDPSRTEVSRAVPEVKVTPLINLEEQVKLKTPEGSIASLTTDSQSHMTFDWDMVDPEILKQCRITNPVLKDNQYWV
ncbi:chondroitin sulfate proteoglycan 4-like [Lingula anatina]|uniref:Chondroitin sulfate proteoglycan 4-like n=1 Tax=Lingula anatina TaxID=7574 RepID=A0A1S3K5A2_LINAN|nr:chondroitin sulfate proteoglycan 4-like [Lingula anatina]|eukprot:XP_013417687.1 chondroitin sulfate proteoglycan 4-like [Lingula anatina]